MNEEAKLVDRLKLAKVSVDNAKSLHEKATSDIQVYVRNKGFPLNERLEIWAEWCSKHHLDWISGTAFFPAVDGAIRSSIEYETYNRYQTIDLLEQFQDEISFVFDVTGKEDWSFEFPLEEDRAKARLICEELIELGAGTMELDW